MSTTKINTHVSFDVPAVISNPELGFANYTSPQGLAKEIAKLNITGAVFTFAKTGGSVMIHRVSFPQSPGGGTHIPYGKIAASVELDADTEYLVTMTLEFADKPEIVSAAQTINTDDAVEYGEIAKRITEGGQGRTTPIGGAVIEIENPAGAPWTATSRASDGLVYLQRIPEGSYNVISITHEDYQTVTPDEDIQVTAGGINWNAELPRYNMMPNPTATPTGE